MAQGKVNRADLVTWHMTHTRSETTASQICSFWHCHECHEGWNFVKLIRTRIDPDSRQYASHLIIHQIQDNKRQHVSNQTWNLGYCQALIF